MSKMSEQEIEKLRMSEEFGVEEKEWKRKELAVKLYRTEDTIDLFVTYDKFTRYTFIHVHVYKHNMVLTIKGVPGDFRTELFISDEDKDSVIFSVKSLDEMIKGRKTVSILKDIINELFSMIIKYKDCTLRLIEKGEHCE
jgi:hypothetical protein